MAIVWLPRAKEDLIKQTAWLEEHRGHQVVVQYFEQVYAAIERLSAGDLALYRLHDARRNIRCCTSISILCHTTGLWKAR